MGQRESWRAYQKELESFAEKVNATALATRGVARWTGGKVFVSALAESFPDMRLITFKSRLVDAARAGLVLLSRADLVSAYPQTFLRRSEIRAGGESYHFVETQYIHRR